MFECNGQALPPRCAGFAGKTAAPLLFSHSETPHQCAPWVVTSSSPCPGCQAPRPSLTVFCACTSTLWAWRALPAQGMQVGPPAGDVVARIQAHGRACPPWELHQLTSSRDLAKRKPRPCCKHAALFENPMQIFAPR